MMPAAPAAPTQGFAAAAVRPARTASSAGLSSTARQALPTSAASPACHHTALSSMRKWPSTRPALSRTAMSLANSDKPATPRQRSRAASCNWRRASAIGLVAPSVDSAAASGSVVPAMAAAASRRMALRGAGAAGAVLRAASAMAGGGATCNCGDVIGDAAPTAALVDASWPACSDAASRALAEACAVACAGAGSGALGEACADACASARSGGCSGAGSIAFAGVFSAARLRCALASCRTSRARAGEAADGTIGAVTVASAGAKPGAKPGVTAGATAGATTGAEAMLISRCGAASGTGSPRHISAMAVPSIKVANAAAGAGCRSLSRQASHHGCDVDGRTALRACARMSRSRRADGCASASGAWRSAACKRASMSSLMVCARPW